jgi:hypothetical protein
MGSEFSVYFQLGLHHILDPRGYDHILFVAALTAAYGPREWRRLLGLVTAFTVGHSITLALATVGLVHVDSAVVEVLIPATIVVTSLVSAAGARRMASGPDDARAHAATNGVFLARYAMAAGFGLIHGLGFSTFLRSALGVESSIGLPLLAFNVGLEFGQIAIVLGVLAFGTLAARLLHVARRDWLLFLCGATAGVGVTMIVDRLTDVR